MAMVATTFASADVRASQTAIYETVLLVLLGVATGAGLFAVCTWAYSASLGFKHRKRSASASDMVFRFRDIMMESCLIPQDDFIRLAATLSDEELRTFESTCKTLVATLLKKQYTDNPFGQRLIAAEYDTWDARGSTRTVLSATFSGELFRSMMCSGKSRIALFTLAEELISEGSLPRILKEAMALTAAEQPANGNCNLISAMQKSARQWARLESVSKTAFKEAVASSTALGDEDLDYVFQMVDDGTGSALAKELYQLLSSAYSTMSQSRNTRRSTHKSWMRELFDASRSVVRLSQLTGSSQESRRGATSTWEDRGQDALVSDSPRPSCVGHQGEAPNILPLADYGDDLDDGAPEHARMSL
eukprot:TRINITY_DN95568_c0_g1_i1.p1 TRINITY_DN95568_c0_g1~~TRINITY_DN95568_c0_g1_i1.p1  ORF type:complete len:379 (+),score=62.19 TRINITY_DN95568_c0_g1_i1:56-1138(+)